MSKKFTKYEYMVYASARKVIPDLKMTKIRPDFLYYPVTERNLELDLYSEKYNLFIDVRGREHRVFPNKYSRRGWQTQTQFDELQARDRWKIDQCLRANMKVIIVDMPLKKEALYAYLSRELSNIINKRT